ncbi:hypothetical protein N7522_006819 [Penicillium canescens]|uniref:Uncharacterized protein n=1 Tax=Penicillium canescens TaxID=5083 RepID=A0AAD6N6N4_PENCN|nr:uncharacterized protein N7446_010108 [Penicillium canescens]KAJ6001592.1 hypothetical protein N7522_006819 [Penicillium canescens]KAJ6035349.1 hypothetical protein N7460_009524 [Penicillium canescens]KAJ6037477.1 hypothetical protein N7444_010182 [Penicillium canescens]KAJ6054096.1 hypothetical protein N7446_010108 [Penicillium canescens]
MPGWLPSEEFHYEFSAERQAEIVDITEQNDWLAEICDTEREWWGCEVRIRRHFQRLLISLGYAAQRMPCLKSLKFGVEEDDYRVAKAWGFDLDDVIIDDQSPVICTLKLPNWPSNEPKSRFLE